MTSSDQAGRPEPNPPEPVRAEFDRPEPNLPAPDELGFSTRAIRAASHVPDVHLADLQRDFARAFAIAGIDVEAAAPALAT